MLILLSTRTPGPPLGNGRRLMPMRRNGSRGLCCLACAPLSHLRGLSALVLDIIAGPDGAPDDDKTTEK